LDPLVEREGRRLQPIAIVVRSLFENKPDSTFCHINARGRDLKIKPTVTVVDGSESAVQDLLTPSFHAAQCRPRLKDIFWIGDDTVGTSS
jgi:hypothetical protein